LKPGTAEDSRPTRLDNPTPLLASLQICISSNVNMSFGGQAGGYDEISLQLQYFKGCKL